MAQRKTRPIDRFGFVANAFSTLVLAGIAVYILIVANIAWNLSQDRWVTVFIPWLSIICLVFIAAYYALKQFNLVVGKVIAIFVEFGLGAIDAIYFLFQEKSWCIDFPAWNQFIGILGIGSGLVAIFLNITLLCIKANGTPKLSRDLRIALILGAISCGFIAWVSATNWFDPYYHARVPAKNEAPPMQFMFWSNINISTFTTPQWQELNNHSAIIVAYGLNKTTNDTFTWAQYLRDHYSRIKLMWPMGGGYYDVCGDYAQTIEQDTYDYLHGIRDYGLNNTIGFVYDLERCNNTCWHDATKWQQFQASMARCFTAIRAWNASYRIDNTDGIWMMYTPLPFAGGDATEILFQHALMSLDSTARWTSYEWQLYRGNANGQSDPDSTNTYERMLSSVRGVGVNKTVPLFGMTGVGDYGPNNCSVNGITCNFAGVIKDCRLARSLGIREVGFYTLCNASTYQGVYYPDMFQAYGQRFLDVLDLMVNGLDEAMMIDVPGNNVLHTSIGYYWEFVGYNISGVACGIIISIAVASTLLLDWQRNHLSDN
ncbi:MAG TPA: hypothetical protein VKM55_28530 [Candidatus Lokiarchaeia archaeon]|nr:hypothetical protein [Candidatus Lokiarchaeia archaeon]